MATRLEIAKEKLIKLEKEFEERCNSLYNHMRQANGQPMNDKKNGPSFFIREEQLENRIFDKLKEIEED